MSTERQMGIVRYGQLNLEGKTKTEVAIARLQEYEKLALPQGFYLAFSGGKDSITLYDLALKAGVKFDAHYNMTGIDPPELVKFIRENYLAVEWSRPKDSMWNLIQKHGLPRRQARWCCQELKEGGGAGRYVLTGIRWAESARRSKRKMLEVCHSDKTRIFIHPIIDWGQGDVWEYIKGNKIKYCSLYDEGFTRLGCILCPMISRQQTKREAQRFPKITEAWRRAAYRYWEKHTPGTLRFPTPEQFWAWYLSKISWSHDEAQCVMFDN